MKYRLWFDAQFCGREETIVDIPDGASDKYIKQMFEKEMGFPFDENCGYEIAKDQERMVLCG